MLVSTNSGQAPGRCSTVLRALPAQGTQLQLNQAHEALASATGAEVVPVGPVWQAVHAALQDVRLFDDDGSHPTAAGAYVTACVFLLSLEEGDPACPYVPDRGVSELYAARIGSGRSWAKCCDHIARVASVRRQGDRTPST